MSGTTKPLNPYDEYNSNNNLFQSMAILGNDLYVFNGIDNLLSKASLAGCIGNEQTDCMSTFKGNFYFWLALFIYFLVL